MSKYTVFVMSIFLSIVLFTRCKKSSGPSNPDVSNFVVVDSASSFIPGNTATISVSSSSLPDGVYTVDYGIGSNHTSTNNKVTTLTITNKSGTFVTPILDSAELYEITVNSITNSDRYTSAVKSRNTAILTDSIGLLTGTVSGLPLKAVYVHAENDSPYLQIECDIFHPGGISSILLGINNYIANPGPGTFSIPANAAAFYPATYNPAVYGQITLTTVSPQMTGSFSFTCKDSTKMSGNFSCPAP